MTGTVIGTLGSSWRATVTEAGAVVPADGDGALEWWVAADDRWHEPAAESSRRQRRLRGAPVIETVIAVPSGDVAHRAYAVPVGSGTTAVIELENRSALPVAVAFSRPDVTTGRPVAVVAPGAPTGAAAAVPVGHRSTVRVVVGVQPAPAAVPPADQVARGWVAQTETGARYAVPDDVLVERVVAARCDALLTVPDADPVGRLLAIAERVRLGEPPAPWVDDVADRAIAVARAAGRCGAAWDDVAALEAATDVLRRAEEPRGAGDLDAMRTRLGAGGPAPGDAPAGIRVVSWLAGRLVRPTAGGADLLAGFDPEWAGQGLEVYGAPIGAATVGFAVRWHGGRPALLWDASVAMDLTCSGLDPAWSTSVARGEALLSPFSQSPRR
jgi:hypothetical protein